MHFVINTRALYTYVLLLQVAGQHVSTYEQLYREADPMHKGYVAAQDAAKYLKKSNLSNMVLGRVSSQDLQTFDLLFFFISFFRVFSGITVSTDDTKKLPHS